MSREAASLKAKANPKIPRRGFTFLDLGYLAIKAREYARSNVK
jgi:hypothetical protein